MDRIVTAKLFKNGNSQALRLPRQFRFDGDEVIIYREGGKVILQPLHSDWETFFRQDPAATEDFLLERGDAPPQARDLF